MLKKVLIIEHSSTLAMRVKLLLELQNCEVESVHEMDFTIQSHESYYDMVVVEFLLSGLLIKQLKDNYRFCTFVILAASPDSLDSTKELLQIQAQLPGSVTIFDFYSNKDILAEMDNLLQLSTDSGELPLPKLLVVDDDINRLKSLKSTLLDVNLQVVDLSLPANVTEFISQIENVDILISDFNMLQCSGIDVFRQVKHKFKDCQCILLTSRTHHSVLVEVIREGVSEVLEKPLDQNLLLQSIHKIWHTQMLKRANQNLITRWQETLDDLVEHGVLLRVVYNTTLDGVMVVDETGRILESNNSCKALLGFAKEELQQIRFQRILTYRSKVKLFKMIRKDHQMQRFSIEVIAKVKSGNFIPLYISFSKINYHGRRVYAGTLRNISQFVNQREQLKQQKVLLEAQVNERTKALENAKNAAEQANSSKSVFLANMSHELRTPMHSILSFARFGIDMLSAKNIKAEKLLKYYMRIVTSGEHLLKLLNNLLDLSKLNAGKFPFHPSISSVRLAVMHVLQEASAVALEHGIQIKTKMLASTDLIWCDVELVQQIVRNLLGNALRFSPDNALISINIVDGHIKKKGASIKAIVITVTDQGVGIPDNELEHIFDQFAQSSITNKGAGGTGLGLAICKDLVELHQGEIFAANNANAGATFTVKLPFDKLD